MLKRLEAAARGVAWFIGDLGWRFAYLIALLFPWMLWTAAPELRQASNPQDAGVVPLVWVGIAYVSVLVFVGLVVLRRLLTNPHHSPNRHQ